MSPFPVLRVTKQTVDRTCGEFEYQEKMPWGPWYLTKAPKTLFETSGISVLECFANELIGDENGFVVRCSPENDPCFRHFFVGKTADGSILWWHNLGLQRYDVTNKRFCKTSITFGNDQVVIQGYGFEVDPHEKLTINIKTGEKAKLLVPRDST